MILENFKNLKAQKSKSLAVLMDPDNLELGDSLRETMKLINSSGVDFIFYGGSLLVEDKFESILQEIKRLTDIPIVIFPGSIEQVSKTADALLFLSLISGRNPEFLIGNQVLSAPKIKKLGIEAIPTGYMLVDCGNQTTASYISNTTPLPYDKPDLGLATALAGEMLGLRCLYLDGGSGAKRPVTSRMIQKIAEHTNIPLIVGGGIRSHEQALEAWSAGANIVVVGTAFEDDPTILFDLALAKEAN